MLSQLQDSGFALVPALVASEQVNLLIAAIDRLQQSLQADGSQAGIRHILRVPEVREFAESAPVFDLVKQVLGPKAVPVRGIFFDKTPDANWKVAWHQDLTIAVSDKLPADGFTAWSQKEGIWHVQPPRTVLENMVTARLHLDDCDEANGPLQVIPGSHSCGRLDAETIQKVRKEHSPVLCTARAGDVLFMRPLILHASSAATVARHRRVVHIEYAAGDLPSGLQWRIS